MTGTYGLCTARQWPGTRRVDGLNQAHRTRILRDHPVRGQQGDPLDQGLGDEKAIKGVFVQRWQIVNTQCMVAGHGQFCKVTFPKVASEDPPVNAEVGAIKAALDGDFPKTDRAEK